MITQLFKTVALIALVAVVFTGCQKEERGVLIADSMEELKKAMPEDYHVCWGIEFPTDTQFKIEDSTVHYQLPEGYTAIGKNKEGEEMRLTEGSIKCDCTSEDGDCKPFKAGSFAGCATNETNTCTTCVGRTDVGGISSLSNLVFQREKKDSWSDVTYLSDTYLILYYNEMFSLKSPNKETWEDRDSQSIVNDMLQNVYPNGIDEAVKQGDAIPTGYGLVPINLKGCLAYLLVPKKKIEEGMLYIPNTLGGDGEYCTGSCSGGTCELKSKNFGFLKYCEGCSSGCTLHW